MKKIFLFLFIVTFSVSFIQSQHTILFLSGDTGDIRNYKYNEEGTFITYHVPNDKNQTSSFSREIVEIDLSDVFSITSSKGIETIIYKPDTASGNLFSINEMRSFIKGEQACKLKYNPKLYFIGSGAISLTTAAITPIILGTGYLLYTPIEGLLAGIGANLMSEKKETIIKLNPEFADDEHFILGYQDASSKKNLSATIKGSTIGLLIGIVGVIAVSSIGK